MSGRDLIIGQHGIEEALKNPERSGHHVYSTHDALMEFQKKSGLDLKREGIELTLLKPHALQEMAKKFFDELGFHYQRVPSQIFLVTSEIPQKDLNWLYERLKMGPQKILCLDQVTDVHNAAAILRTAAFYGVHAMLVSQKGSFGASPSFHRLASGASEHVPIVRCSSLPTALSRLQERGVLCVGLSEHAEDNNYQALKQGMTSSSCLVLGAEDVGLSHAVSRVIEHRLSLTSQGAIKSLNVSVAAALAMEKFFSPESA